MPFRPLHALLPCVLMLWGLLPCARATTIDPLTLEQLVSQAAFVGIVECEVAGGIVARYRVVESWKGVKAGTRFSMRTEVNYWEPQFPISLVGERSVVTAFASEAPNRIRSTTSGGGVPLWWRAVPYQYALPLFQGSADVPSKPVKNYYAFGAQHPSFTAFRTRVRGFLARRPEEREVATMRSVWNKYSRRDLPSKAGAGALRKRIAAARSAGEISSALLALERQNRSAPVALTLAAGGTATLKFLQVARAPLPFDQSERERIVDSIRANIKTQQSSNAASQRAPVEVKKFPNDKLPAPDAKTLAAMRRILAGKGTPADAKIEQNIEIDVFGTLSRHDPATVARHLVNLKSRSRAQGSDGSYTISDDPQTADRAYVMASYFAWRCGGNRTAHLRSLLGAHEPFVRVAGAVYLTFESKNEGLTALRFLQSLPGDAGVWAALSLARRGDKTAMPRLLRVFEMPGESGTMAGVPHGNLQKRVLVLLSNSAKKSGVPQPVAAFRALPSSGWLDTSERDSEALYARRFSAHLQSWWKKHAPKLELYDPWLAILEQQKVD